MINDWGISSEPIEEFVKRNQFNISPTFPQNLKDGREVHFNNSIDFLPIIGFENEDWEAMHQEARNLEKHYVPHRHHESHKGWASLCIHALVVYIPKRILHMGLKKEKMHLTNGPMLQTGVLLLLNFLCVILTTMIMTEYVL